ncbi:MAG: phage tail protein [Draconibacterium sp.]|nr:phage tail protein [Draconibacterium sp.]
MSEPFLAEIKIVGFNFAPRGWAFCDGQILPINQNQALYSLLGTTYGGDGRITFALPGLRGRTPVGVGNYVNIGQKGGTETETLTAPQIPVHSHNIQLADAEGTNTPTNTASLSKSKFDTRFTTEPATQNMHTNSITNTGGGLSHSNMQPYLAVNYCIALIGLFPSRN